MWTKFCDFCAQPGKGEIPLILRALGCEQCMWRGCVKCDIEPPKWEAEPPPNTAADGEDSGAGVSWSSTRLKRSRSSTEVFQVDSPAPKRSNSPAPKRSKSSTTEVAPQGARDLEGTVAAL